MAGELEAGERFCENRVADPRHSGPFTLARDSGGEIKFLKLLLPSQVMSHISCLWGHYQSQ